MTRRSYAVWQKYYTDRHHRLVHSYYTKYIDIYLAESQDDAVICFFRNHRQMDEQELMLGMESVYVRPVVGCYNAQTPFPKHWADDADYEFLLTEKLSPTRAVELLKVAKKGWW